MLYVAIWRVSIRPVVMRVNEELCWPLFLCWLVFCLFIIVYVFYVCFCCVGMIFCLVTCFMFV